MRITGGDWRGRPLAAPGATKGIRPTSDRTREALFSILLSAGWEPTGATVLDLFAGTGALGLEALSRGAASATFVEKSAPSRAILARNLKAFFEAQTTLITGDATRLRAAPHPHSIAFADPPYGKGLAEKALIAALAQGWLAPGARIVIEENAPVTLAAPFQITDTRRYGDTHVTFAVLA